MEEKTSELYMLIFSIKETHQEDVKKSLKVNKEKMINNFRLKHLNLYESLRGDCDIIGWLSADDPSNILSFLKELKTIIDGKGNIVHSFHSIYQRSPYLKNSLKIEEQIRHCSSYVLIHYSLSVFIRKYIPII